jgi:hypothetical protein
MSRHLTQLRGISTIGAAAALAACSGAEQPPAAQAESAPPSPPQEISIPGTGIFPESLTAAADGSIYIGSVGKGQVYKVAPGGTVAEPFIAPGTGGIKQVFGVLADGDSGTLWACSNQVGGGPPGAAPPAPSALHAFELASGTHKASYALPAGGFCNDIAVGPAGDTYATDTNGMLVLRLPKGGTKLEVWTPAGAFGPAGGVLDGITVVGGRVLVNTLRTNKLFAVEVASDGKAGEVKELQLSAPLSGPDGMRAHGSSGLLVTNNTGLIQHVVIEGDAGMVTTVKDGLEGPVSVAVVGKTAYALEGQLGIMMAAPGTTPPAEKPYRAVGFPAP